MVVLVYCGGWDGLLLLAVGWDICVGLFICGVMGRCLLLIICWVVSRFGFA